MNRDAKIKVVSMSPAILVWYQIVTSCNLLVLVFKTVNCNKAVYIDMYFQFCGNGMTQMLSMLPGRCLWSGRSPNDAICCADSSAHIGVIMFCLTWASLLWPRQLQRIMSFDFAALRWTTVGISAMAEELQKDRRQMQRRTERPPGPALHFSVLSRPPWTFLPAESL